MKFTDAVNAWIMDGLTTLMLLAFAIEAAARVFAMTKWAIKRAMNGDGEK